jgi:hypothetical protein
MVKILEPFKITNVERSSLLFRNEEDFDGRWVEECRREGVAIMVDKL